MVGTSGGYCLYLKKKYAEEQLKKCCQNQVFTKMSISGAQVGFSLVHLKLKQNFFSIFSKTLGNKSMVRGTKRTLIWIIYLPALAMDDVSVEALLDIVAFF